MNKDLDERLVPNGEYRDAMNIQVSTSEGSNVGAVQNVLGNTNLSSIIGDGYEPDGWVCVGAVEDEKENCLYWFVTTTKADGKGLATKDMILRYKEGVITPVLVDMGGYASTGDEPLGFHRLVDKSNLDVNKVITGINIVDNLLFWTDNYSEPKKINIENCILGTPDFNTHTKLHNPLIDTVGLSGSIYTDSSVDIQQKHVTVIKKAPSHAPTVELTKLDNLNNPGIIDNYRFADSDGGLWSPGNYPGASNGVINFVIRNSSTINDYNIVPGQTVIHLKSVKNNDIGFDVNSDNIIDELNQNFNQNYSYFSDYDIRLKITSFSIAQSQAPTGTALSGYVDVHCEILSIKPTTTPSFSAWVVNFEQAVDSLFENKFPRFAYRYKYLDGESSPFSPFSNVAFQPHVYSHDSVQGYNVGMKNYLSKVSLRNFVLGDFILNDGTISTRKIPHDVVGVELLYKESNSPNVYIVDSVTPKDNKWYLAADLTSTGVYDITSDTIFKILPSNQLLRSFDSVPKKAVAQEVTGNRLIYANYTENINITSNEAKIIPDLSFSYIQNVAVKITNDIAVPSLKTLRSYQIGVVYEDKYGRQTPVFTNDLATLNLPITESTTPNMFQVQVNSQIPDQASSYKFFIKETSNEYYNIALDRWYDARDGNIWLSFNSADRNKVDEETYLYLKKQHGSDVAVKTPNKYKILSIKNDAPDYIKTVRKSLGANIFHSTLSTNLLFNDSTFYPLKDKTEFRMNTVVVESSTLADIGQKFNLEMRLSIPSENNYSDRYQITNVVKDVMDPQGYIVSIKGKFKSDVNFIEAASSTSSTPVLKNNVYLEITEGEVTNKPEFDGKFFIKIFKDFNISSFILPFSGSSDNLAITHQEPLYYYNTSMSDLPCLNGGNNFNSAGNSQNRTGSYDVADARSDAAAIFGDGTTSNTLLSNGPRWFIDKIPWEAQAAYNNNGFIDHQGGSIYSPGINNGVNGFEIDISYSGIRNSNFTGLNYEYDVFAVGEPSNTLTDHEITMTSNLVPGKRFYFADDPDKTVYTISSVQVFEILNYVQFAGSGTFGLPYFLDSTNLRKTWRLTLDKSIDQQTYSPVTGSAPASDTVQVGMNFVDSVIDGDSAESLTKNPAIFETKPKEDLDLDIYYEASDSFDRTMHGRSQALNWFNCYSFGNGVESDRIQDDFNTPTIDNGPKVSTVFEGEYKEQQVKNGLIYSGIYNYKNNFNKTNEFISAEKITKDVNPVYGSIQKLYTRDGDLIALCEDKILRILANKDAIFNADGNVQLTANENVLGQTIPFAGDYGISKDPSSFVSKNFRAYFTDKQRGAVLRLSRDGLTPISMYGMKDYFADNLKLAESIIGSYDTKNDEYNVTLLNNLQDRKQSSTTISFSDTVNGWSSFKSFIPEFGLSLSNDYYTFKNGNLYQHNNTDYNSFYGAEGYPSSITVVLNDVSGSVKSFKTLNYEGSQSQVFQENKNTSSGYYNLNPKKGWAVTSISTDREEGFVNEFIKKEGKWFNFVKGKSGSINTDKFSFQGIGVAKQVTSKK